MTTTNEPNEDPETTTLHRVVIRYGIDRETSEPVVSTWWDDEMPIVHALGMVEMAKDTILRSYMNDPEHDDEGQR